MKVLLTAVLTLLLVPSAHAGMGYDFRSISTGLSKQTITGSVRAEGAGMRIDFTAGDELLFRGGTYALTSAGRKIVTVVDPSAKTFYELDTDRLLGNADTMLKQFGGKFTVSNPKALTTDGGDGGRIAGFPARKSKVESSFDVAVQALGQNMKIQMQNSTDVWWTRSIGAEYANFLQKGGFKTGIEAVDKLLTAQTSTAANGFPLRQITTTKVVLNGNAMTSTTTSEVSNVRQMKVAPSLFVVPAGFLKVASPVEKMLSSRKP